MTRIVELARVIEENTKLVDAYLEKNALKTPSFEADGPVDFGISDPDVEKARLRASEASLELHGLLEGPRMQLRPKLNALPLQTIYRHNLASLIPTPPSPPISFTTLSTLTTLPLSQLRQTVRYAITMHHIFSEPIREHITHSATSLLLLLNEPSALDGLGFMFDETWPAFARTLDAAEKWPGSREPNHTGFSLAMGTDKGMYGYYEEHPEIARRFASAMGLAGARFERSLLAREVGWGELGGGEGASVTVVDVGGSKGHVSVGLARLFGGLRFVVQDLAEALVGAEGEVPGELKERVSFEVYDFFTEQTVKGAEVYLFSHILHNWSDAHVLKILENLIPALKKGAKVVINDAILPEPGDLGWFQERDVRYIDVAMWSMYNARERERDDWIELLKKADERFGDVKFHTGGSAWGVIEATWKG